MKKYTLYSLMLLTIVISISLFKQCRNLRKKTMYNLLKMLRLKFLKTIFTSSKKNETINEDEMRKSIKDLFRL